MKKFDPKYHRYIYLGVTLVLVNLASMVLFSLYFSWDTIEHGLHMLNEALTPIYIGLIIAYLLTPLVNKADLYIFIPLLNKIKKKKTGNIRKIARGLSVTLVVLVMFFCFFALFWMVIPEVVDSLTNLVTSMPSYYNNIVAKGEKIFKSNPETAEYFANISKNVYDAMMTWLKDDLLPTSTHLLEEVKDGVVSTVNYIVNIFIGTIISIYLMAGKERFCAQAKKLMYVLIPEKKVTGILDFLSETNQIFGRFISGKLIDSIMIGVVTSVVLLIANVPYALLVGVIMGVTNIIPFFGPYIGTIPSAILIFMAEPIKGVVFLVFIIILMQVDGNVISPKILGDSIGLDSFWILFSILFFGSLFDLVGMVCGVPVFAVLYRLVKRWCDNRLRKKGLNESSDSYITIIEREKKTKEEKVEEE